MKILIYDLVNEAAAHCPKLNDRAKFIKFYLEEKEGKYWNVFIFDDRTFGKRCNASDNKYLLFRLNKVFYLIWLTKI